jgi:hypothetical protein
MGQTAIVFPWRAELRASRFAIWLELPGTV